MKRSILNTQNLLFFFVLLLLASCKATKTVTSYEKLKPISTNRLIKNIEDNAFEYKGLDIKRIACVYETPDNKTSFRATLSSKLDEHIQVTISKLNLPVARILLTPDSVKMINYLQKTYFLGDYSYIEKMLGAAVDFQVVQSILTNDVFSYRKDEKDNDFKEFVSYTDSGNYVLQSVKNRKLDKISRKGKDDKVDRYLKKLDEESFIVQYLYVDPVTFKVRKIIMDDVTEGRKVSVNFDEFTPVEKQLYPGSIDIHFVSQENDLKMKIKLSKFSLDPDPTINFNIPEKYKLAN
ncbi:DUF4292 domain-containing protein [Mangrovibacterium diazotrophicum]|uniref:Uncharacterized protein DUF4292 n=1 Tax=Mangrovibacterium diazotrophicum TaxID=1261403 RepID=A0A419WA43_9BACT|nr:DUF4292 domain-containing protein [Mangrovibacterium diazotrophicum]RKD92286.1 uncharacterized protein DUF4292 [Mangrovibacterium diazotrophicum]